MSAVATPGGSVDHSTSPSTEVGVAVAFDQSPMDWAAVVAGAVVASGIAFVFTTFGAALGMSLISPYDGEGSPVAAAVAVGLWMLWTTISSFMAGGYIAGRLRRRMVGTSEHEVSVRDGLHGLVVWGLAILLGAFLLGSTLDTTITAASAAGAQAVDQSTPGAGTQTTTVTAPDMDSPQAKAMAETARKYSVVSAFVTAAALLIAGAAAYWAAGTGGRHRDESQEFAAFGSWR